MAEKYIPLYRKYRPQEFADLVGQDNLVNAFTNAINTGKIAHAYLFCGPRGTGKTSSARILAKSLNCQNGPTLNPCGKCPSCLDILNGNMLDVIEMDAASNRSVEDAQNIIDKIHYAPVNGKYKIFIIDEVHMISKTAFNALLKTLEEPPENVIFILATTEPQKVLETIISRCQRFDFRRITVDDIVKRLEYISKKEDIKISNDALYTIAKNSQGGMRDALALLDQISVLDMTNEITSDKVNEMLGRIDNDTLLELSQYIFDKKVDLSVQKINEIYSKGNEPLQIIENLIQYFRNLSVVKTCKDEKTIADLTLLSKDVVPKMKNQVQNISVEKISHIIERLTYYHREIKFTNNRYLWLELCFIDIASENLNYMPATKPVPSTETKVVSQPVKTADSFNSKPITQIKEPETVKEEAVEVENKNETKLKKEEELQKEVNAISKEKEKGSADDWKNVLELIESPPSRSFFNTFAKPVEMTEAKVVITFKNDTFAQRAKEPQKSDAMKKACMKFYNVPSIELEIKVGATPYSTKNTKQEQETQPETEIPLKTTQPQTKQIDKEQQITVEEDDIKPQPLQKTNKYETKYNDQVKMVKDLFDAKIFE